MERYTATEKEQENLRLAHSFGARIEAKARSCWELDIPWTYDAVWAPCENPKWLFSDNHYRLSKDQPIDTNPRLKVFLSKYYVAPKERV
jgi:hypothetical protein